MKQFVLYSIVLFTIIISCKKKNTINPDAQNTVIPIKADTLTSGWRKVNLSNNVLNEIFFQNNNVGYASGQDGIYKSIDGGLKWTFLINRFAINIAVTTNGNAFFVKDSVYKTTNAGASFTSFYSQNTTDIFFLNNNEGFFINGTQLYYTTDAGVTWQNASALNLPFTTSGYSALCFNSPTSGLVVTYSGVYKTNGGISNWIASNFLNANSSNYGYQAAFFTPNNNAYVINNNGKLYKSTDAGVNFSLIKDFTNGVNNTNSSGDIHFIDNNVGYASSSNKIYKTIDGGLNWSVVVALGEGTIVEIHFTDATHGWACTINGKVLIFN
jgi:photosystem II stability/assembly factor-like uncharacterized protein